MSDPRTEDHEYGEDDAMKAADMNMPSEDGDDGDDDEDADMDAELSDDQENVPGERQAPRLPGDTMAERE